MRHEPSFYATFFSAVRASLLTISQTINSSAETILPQGPLHYRLNYMAELGAKKMLALGLSCLILT